MRMIKGQKGLSLVEVTIMLLVLMLLTSVLAPSIWDFVHDAQWVKVKEDCEAIGISFSRLTRDVGPCLRADPANQLCDMANRLDVMYSDGDTPTIGLGTAVVNANITTKNWTATPGARTDSMDNQFVTNLAGYATPWDKFQVSGTFPVGPQFGLGWRGAYLSPPVGPDPWGSKYFVNSGFNAVASGAADGTVDGKFGEWWERDVVCLSAGPNQTIESWFGQYASGSPNYGANRLGDDFIFVISGSGR